MRTVVAATLILPLTLLAVVALVNAVNFDNLPVGTAPVGWTATRTGTGEAKWTVEKDDTAPSKPNVLKQSGPATYPVCIKDDTSLKDGFVEVKFKPISGREDQAGGLVWPEIRITSTRARFVGGALVSARSLPSARLAASLTCQSYAFDETVTFLFTEGLRSEHSRSSRSLQARAEFGEHVQAM